MGALEAPGLHPTGFGGFVTSFHDGLAVVGIWGSSHPCNNITMEINRILDEKIKMRQKIKRENP